MSLSFETARDEILTLFKTAWDLQVSPPVVYYSDVAHDPFEGQNANTDPSPFATISVRHILGFTGAIGNKCFDRQGEVLVAIYTPFGDGMVQADTLSKVAVDAFQGKATAGGAWFRNVSMMELGQRNLFFETNVSADFEYSEVI